MGADTLGGAESPQSSSGSHFCELYALTKFLMEGTEGELYSKVESYLKDSLFKRTISQTCSCQSCVSFLKDNIRDIKYGEVMEFLSSDKNLETIIKIIESSSVGNLNLSNNTLKSVVENVINYVYFFYNYYILSTDNKSLENISNDDRYKEIKGSINNSSAYQLINECLKEWGKLLPEERVVFLSLIHAPLIDALPEGVREEIISLGVRDGVMLSRGEVVGSPVEEIRDIINNSRYCDVSFREDEIISCINEYVIRILSPHVAFHILEYESR